MKTCPYCAEEIQDAAIKCKHCGEMLGPLPASSASSEDRGGSEAIATRAVSNSTPPIELVVAEVSGPKVEAAGPPGEVLPEISKIASANNTNGCAAVTVGSLMGLTGLFIGFSVFDDSAMALFFGLVGVGWAVAAALYKPKD